MAENPARRLVLGLAAGVLLTLAATAAGAHAHLTASNPPANAVVPPPRTLSLTFSDPVEPKFSGLKLTGPSGPVKLTVSASADRKSLLATPATPLTAGAYKAAWHAVAKDGHRMEGAYAFTVR